MASSSSALQWKHTVFLSFSGEDVRDSFISFLYRDLCKIASDVYIDYRLKPAEEIAPALMEAIERSMIAVIIFSKSYASSTWCLDELEKIIECNKSHGQMVIPVFYNVDSAHVHDPTAGIYAEAFARHDWNLKGTFVQRLTTTISKALLDFVFLGGREEHQDELDQVQRWKNAMIKAANFKGWDSKVIRPDTALVDVIVKDVLAKLMQISPSSSEGGFVGIESRVKRIEELLSLQENDVCVLGLWGMGGVGKTTTAKLVFKQILSNFDASCFLENIGEESGKPGGLSRLRKELLSKILGNVPNIEHSYILKQMLSLKKALIVLDGLTDLEQLNTLIGDTRCFGWLGSGSRIIITCRNREIVGKKGILGGNVRVIDPYEVKRLSHADSFTLFSHNAFEHKQVPKDFWVLSGSFVKYAEGNPLGLKVLGRHLLGRDLKSWERSLANLTKGTLKGIQSVLRLSYDELSHDGKEMFLYIACFLNGEGVDVSNELFQLCDFSEDISYLVEKCLLNVSSGGKVQMHHLVREMGREIERHKPLPDRARLWNYKDISKVFKSEKEWERIESISLDISKTNDVLHLDTNAFARTPNLKFLRFYASKEDGDSKDRNKHKVVLPEQGLVSFPDDLLYLYWYGFPSKSLPEKFNPSSLVVLRLPHSNVAKLLGEDKRVEVSNEFEFQLSHDIVPCSSTNHTYYTNVGNAPSTMKYFGQLRQLDLRYCIYIESIPSTAHLEFLEYINLGGCTNLVNFPDVSKNLISLDLSLTAIKEAPLSILNLNLCQLGLYECPNLTSIPFNIFFSKSLESCSLYQSSNVKILTLLETIYSLPDELVPTISYLQLSGTGVQSIPASIKKLANLRQLYVQACKNLQSVPELPASLRLIWMDNCTSLETICNLQKYFNTDFDLFASHQDFSFTNCLKLDKNTWHDSSAGINLRIKRLAMKAKCYHSEVRPYLMIHYPGNEIPKGFVSSTEGTLVTLELLPQRNSSQFLGFALCAITGPYCQFPDDGLHCRCRFQNNNDDSLFIMCCAAGFRYLDSNHVLIWYDYILNEELEKRQHRFSEDCNYVVSFEFFILDRDLNEHRVTKKCGVLPLYADDAETGELEVALMRPNTGAIGREYKRLSHEYCKYHQKEYTENMN